MVAELALDRGIDQRQPNLPRVRGNEVVQKSGQRLLRLGDRRLGRDEHHQRGVLGGFHREAVKAILSRPLRLLSREKEKGLIEIKNSGMPEILIKRSSSI